MQIELVRTQYLGRFTPNLANVQNIMGWCIFAAPLPAQTSKLSLQDFSQNPHQSKFQKLQRTPCKINLTTPSIHFSPSWRLVLWTSNADCTWRSFIVLAVKAQKVEIYRRGLTSVLSAQFLYNPAHMRFSSLHLFKTQTKIEKWLTKCNESAVLQRPVL